MISTNCLVDSLYNYGAFKFTDIFPAIFVILYVYYKEGLLSKIVLLMDIQNFLTLNGLQYWNKLKYFVLSELGRCTFYCFARQGLEAP